MSASQPIRTLFANDIERTIEEVIKVDQRDEQILVDEIAEYVVTDSIRARFTSILEAYHEAPNKPGDGRGRLGLGLLRLGQVQLREEPGSRHPEPAARAASRPPSASRTAPVTRSSPSC